MTYSYTQINQYIRCPRRYRYRYLDGWQEKGTRASMVFGRVFEKALAALFLRQDPTEVLYAEWGAYREAELEFTKNDDWGKFLQQGVTLLERFVQDNRIKIAHPKNNLQVKILRELPDGNNFVAYIDGIGQLDKKRCPIPSIMAIRERESRRASFSSKSLEHPIGTIHRNLFIRFGS